MPYLSYIVSPYPPTFTRYLCFTLIYLLVFRVLYSGSIGVYTLTFIPCFMLIPYLDSF